MKTVEVNVRAIEIARAEVAAGLRDLSLILSPGRKVQQLRGRLETAGRMLDHLEDENCQECGRPWAEHGGSGGAEAPVAQAPPIAALRLLGAVTRATWPAPGLGIGLSREDLAAALADVQRLVPEDYVIPQAVYRRPISRMGPEPVAESERLDAGRSGHARAVLDIDSVSTVRDRRPAVPPGPGGGELVEALRDLVDALDSGEGGSRLTRARNDAAEVLAELDGEEVGRG